MWIFWAPENVEFRSRFQGCCQADFVKNRELFGQDHTDAICCGSVKERLNAKIDDLIGSFDEPTLAEYTKDMIDAGEPARLQEYLDSTFHLDMS